MVQKLHKILKTTTKMSKKKIIRNGMIPEAAKRFVEQIGFDEKSKSLLSGCFVHRCHVIHLLRREVQQEQAQTRLKVCPM